MRHRRSLSSFHRDNAPHRQQQRKVSQSQRREVVGHCKMATATSALFAVVATASIIVFSQQLFLWRENDSRLPSTPTSSSYKPTCIHYHHHNEDAEKECAAMVTRSGSGTFLYAIGETSTSSFSPSLLTNFLVSSSLFSVTVPPIHGIVFAAANDTDSSLATDYDYVLGIVNPWNYAPAKSSMEAMRHGAIAAVSHQNNNGGGAIRGRNISIAFGDFDLLSGQTTVAPVIDNITATHGDRLIAFVMSSLDVLLDSIVPAVTQHRTTLVGAIGRDPLLRSTFNKYVAHLLPSPEAELLTQMDHMIYTLGCRRIVLVINIINDNPIEQHSIYPVYLMVKRKMAELLGDAVSETAVMLFTVDMRSETNPSATSWRLLANIPRVLAFRPQAIFNAAPATTTGTQLIALLMMQLRDLYVGLFIGQGQMVDQMIASAPGIFIGSRLTVTLPLPLFTTDKPIAVAFRAQMADALARNVVSNMIDVSSTSVGFRGQFAFMAWVHTRFVIEVMRSVNPDLPINKSTFNDALFNFRIQPIGDMFFGMYGNDCTTFQGATCQCNQGGKFVWMAAFDQSGKLSPLDTLTAIPTDKCDSRDRDLVTKNPFAQLRVYPNNDSGSASDAVFPYKATAEAIVSGAQSRAALQSAADTKFKFLATYLAIPSATAVAAISEGTIINKTKDIIACAITNPILPTDTFYPTYNTSMAAFTSTSSSSLTAPLLLDPVRVHPAPHAYSRSTIRITATLDQELHAAASYIASKNGLSLSIVLPNTVPIAYRSAIGELAERSMNTFGISLRAVLTGDTVESILSAMAVPAARKGGRAFDPASSSTSTSSSVGNGGNILFVLGMDGVDGRDADAIASFLEASSSYSVIIPHEHLVLHYTALRSALGSSSSSTSQISSISSRLFFTSNLGPWNSSVSSNDDYDSGLEGAFKSAMVGVASERTPAALLGYATESFVARVLSQLPSSSAITPDIVIDAIFSMTIISVADGLVLGPYSDSECAVGTPTNQAASAAINSNCELNAGARSVSIYSFGDASGLNALPAGTASATPLHSQMFDTARIAYIPLPPAPGPNIGLIVGCTIGAVAALLVALAAAAYTVVQYQKSARAPKDESEPFAIVFTDIQSSTMLWADIPDVMSSALTDHHQIIRRLIRQHSGYEVKTVGDSFMIAFKDVKDAVALGKSLQTEFLAHDWGTDDIDVAYREREWEMAAAVASSASVNNVTPALASSGSPTTIINSPIVTRRTGEEGNYVSAAAALPAEAFSAQLPPELYAKLWRGLRVRVGIHYGLGEIVLDPVSERYDYYGTVTNVAARVEAAGHGGQTLITEAVVKAVEHSGGGSGDNGGTYFSSEAIVELGKCVLRGVSEPVVLYQLTAVEGRVHPPLRDIADTSSPFADEDGGGDMLTGGDGQTNTTFGTDGKEGAGGGVGAPAFELSMRGGNGATGRNSIGSLQMSQQNGAIGGDAFDVASKAPTIGGGGGPNSADNQGKVMVSIVLGVLSAPYAPEGRRDMLKEACNRWQIKVTNPPPTSTSNTLSNQKVTSSLQARIDHMINLLATRLGPIALAKAARNKQSTKPPQYLPHSHHQQQADARSQSQSPKATAAALVATTPSHSYHSPSPPRQNITLMSTMSRSGNAPAMFPPPPLTLTSNSALLHGSPHHPLVDDGGFDTIDKSPEGKELLSIAHPNKLTIEDENTVGGSHFVQCGEASFSPPSSPTTKRRSSHTRAPPLNEEEEENAQNLKINTCTEGRDS